MLEDDAKNYHAWAYRQWVVETYGLWNGELAFTEQLMSEVIQIHACAIHPNLDMLTFFKLYQDVMNNSAWNYRFYVVCHTATNDDHELPAAVLLREIEFAFERIQMALENESSWFVCV